MVDDYDDYDDFDPMDDDESSQDYYISQVIAKYKKLPREKIIKALDDNDWDIDLTISSLKLKEEALKKPQVKQAAQKTPAKQAAQPKTTQPKTSQTEQKKPVQENLKFEIKQEQKKIEESKIIHQRLNQDYPDVHPQITPPGKIDINLVIIGHVDAGKSTLMGHLLFLLGYVDQKTIQKYERESKSIGKESFHFAWVLDASEEERARGVTIDIACSFFSTPNRNITLLDAPGHKDFIPNMISGAAQADAAILVIDASINEFERGFEGENSSHGQTKEHSHLARALGITHIIVAINKLDSVSWDKGRFLYIKGVLERFLENAGFRKIEFVPISGLKGENLNEKSRITQLSWYEGNCLVDYIDNIPRPTRAYSKPFRMNIMDSYKLSHGSIIGQVFSGRIEGGQVKPGDKVVILPCEVTGIVKNIELGRDIVPQAYAGETISLSLKDVTGEFELVVPGDTVCAYSFPVPQVRRFVAKVFTFDILFPITKGLKLMMFIQSLKVLVQVASIKEQINPVNGEIMKTNPRCLTRNMTAVIEIQAERKICIEKFSNYKGLGRVLFRDRSETVMAGMVLELLE